MEVRYNTVMAWKWEKNSGLLFGHAVILWCDQIGFEWYGDLQKSQWRNFEKDMAFVVSKMWYTSKKQNRILKTKTSELQSDLQCKRPAHIDDVINILIRPTALIKACCSVVHKEGPLTLKRKHLKWSHWQMSTWSSLQQLTSYFLNICAAFWGTKKYYLDEVTEIKTSLNLFIL